MSYESEEVFDWSSDLPDSYTDLTKIVVDILGSKGEALFLESTLQDQKSSLEEEFQMEVEPEYTYHTLLMSGLKTAFKETLTSPEVFENYFRNMAKEDAADVFENFNHPQGVDMAELMNHDWNRSEFLSKVGGLAYEFAQDYKDELQKLVWRVEDEAFNEDFNFKGGHIYLFGTEPANKEEFQKAILDQIFLQPNNANQYMRDFGTDIAFSELEERFTTDFELSKSIDAGLKQNAEQDSAKKLKI